MTPKEPETMTREELSNIPNDVLSLIGDFIPRPTLSKTHNRIDSDSSVCEALL